MSSLFLLRKVYLANIHKIYPIKKQLAQVLRAADSSQLGSLGCKHARPTVLPKATERVSMPSPELAITADPEHTVGQAVEIKADKIAPAKSGALP